MAKVIADKTKAIMAVILLGNPCDFETLRKLCKDKDVIL